MFKKIIKYLFVWRLAIFIPAILATTFLPVHDCCRDFGNRLSVSYLLNIWANFAGSDLLALARYNYGLPLSLHTYIFFPLFPWLVRTVAILVPNYLASGLVISHLSLVSALFLFYKLVMFDHNEKVARTTIILLLLFPTAFFFGTVYTESFFLLLVVSTFFLARKKLYLPACLIALLASATRFAGIFLWPALIAEMWPSNRRSLAMAWLLLPPLGLLSYMRFLSLKVGDPLLFLKITPDFGPNLVVTKLILLHQVFFRYVKMLLFSDYLNSLYPVILLEFFVGVTFLILTILAIRQMRLSYGIYALLSYLVPTFTGTFSNLPRFVLTIFPAFILLAVWFNGQSTLVKRVYLFLHLAASIVFISLFTRGYFIG